MRRVNGVTGLAVLAGALICWVGLAAAQSSRATKLPQIIGVEVTPPAATGGQAATSAKPLKMSSEPGAHGSGSPVPNPKTEKSEFPVTGPKTEKTAPTAEDGLPGADDVLPTGRQEPGVSLEWSGPPVAKVGHEADYAVNIRNTSATRLQQVMVGIKVPAGVKVVATEPKALSDAGVLMWEIGSLMSRQEKTLQLRLVPEGKGQVNCQAWATFTGSAAIKIKTCEPRLLVKAQAPEHVLAGDPATITVTVSNPGDGSVDQVKVHAALSDGLEHVKGKTVDFDIGNISPGESRTVQLACATKTSGKQTCEVTAEGDGDLKSQETATVNVVLPHVDLEAAGPKLKYLDRKAVYSFRVTNKGDGPATNVTVTDSIPAGFKFTSASDGGRYDFASRAATWFLGDVGPGQSKEVKLEVQAVNLGQYIQKVSVHGSRGIAADTEVVTQVAALSAVELNVAVTEAPIEVGAETSYEIQITNTGSKPETDIKLVCTIPEKMQFVSAQGPAPYHEQGKDIVFEQLPRLAQRADAIYRVRVKALAPGDVRFKTQMTSSGLMEPVIKTEPTKIYEDQDGKQ